MVIDKLINLGQLLLAVVIVVFVLYRVALLFDVIPEDFSPSGFVHHEYKSFKMSLAEGTGEPGVRGKVAKIMLKNIERIEGYYTAENNMTEEERRIAAACDESALYRFFMFLGGDKGENSACIANEAQIEAENSKKSVVTTPGPTVNSAPIQPTQ